MNDSSDIADLSWVWGSVWLFYALFYGRYFSYMANRLKPNLETVAVQGSPERLRSKARWCKRFAFFMLIPTLLELIRSTDFTSAVISIAPCFFGLWVMHAVWHEIFRSKVPRATTSSAKSPEASKADADAR